MRVALLVLCLGQIGCRQIFGLSEPALLDGGTGDIVADMPFDAPDAGACAAASVSCASPDIRRSCASAGAMPVDEMCAWGCTAADGNAHCAAHLPAGGVLTTADLTTAGLSDIAISGATTIDTDTGLIQGIRGNGQGVLGGVDFILRGNGGVFRMKSLLISAPVLVRGNRPLVIVALDGITISSVVDARGPCTSTTAGPGGSDGGTNGNSAAGPGGGAGGQSNEKEGGGGGGHAGVGGVGGAGALPAGGAIFGDAQISVLRGGGGGGGGGADTSGGDGGGGGGALQLVAATSITINATGTINAGGCGGNPASGGVDSGGGGGAGGTILLEAPIVTIAGALAVNGGGGAGGDSDGEPGVDGRADRMRAAGGNGSDADNGGAGGAGALPNGLPGQQGDCTGGGGGAVGRIRVNTRSGSAVVGASALLSPAFDDNPTTATQAAAATQ